MKHATLAQQKIGFHIHVIVFVPTLAVLAIVNGLTGAPYWVHWVLLGWGIGLFCHWFFVLGPGTRETGSP